MNDRARTGGLEADRLHGVAVHLLRRVRRSDAESGLTPARLSALSVLVFGGPCAIGELAAAEQVAAPTMTRLVDALETDGLVRRFDDAADARVTRVRATARARRLMKAARQRRVDQVVGLLERMRPSERKLVERAVSILERELARPSEPY